MNNKEKKIEWIFEAMRFQLENVPTYNEGDYNRKVNLLNDADRIIADIETEKEEKPTIQDLTKPALSEECVSEVKNE